MADQLAETNNSDRGETAELPYVSSTRTELRQALPNMRLDSTLRIDKRIEKENERHADVYSVFDEQNGCLAQDLEARVFVLDDSYPKLRRYRLQCIKRMKRHTILKKQLQNAVVVVINTSSRPDDGVPGGQDNATFETGGAFNPLGIQTDDQATTSTKQKTSYQREAMRIRQRERRKTRRSEKRHGQHTGDTGGKEVGAGSTRDATWDGDDNDFSWDLVLLLVAYDSDGKLRQQITQEHSDLLKATGSEQIYKLLSTYLDQKTMDFNTLEDMEAFLHIKQSELISLRRQQARILRTEDTLKKRYLEVMLEQNRCVKGSAQWHRFENEVKPHAKFQVEVAKHAKVILPIGIERLQSDCSSIAHRLSVLRDMVAIKKVHEEWEVLKHRVAQLERSTTMVLPLSSTREDLKAQWEAAKRELDSFETRHPGLASMAEVEVDSLFRLEKHPRNIC